VFQKQSKGDVAILTDHVLDVALRLRAPIPESRLVIVHRKSDSKLLDFDDAEHAIIDDSGKVVISFITDEPISLAELGIAEPHNQINATIALICAHHVSHKNVHDLAAALESFQNLPYRCQKIGMWRGKPVINDSKSTNLESTLVALAAQKETCTLLIGGEGKGESYKPIAEKGAQIQLVIAFGASRDAIVSDLSPTLRVVAFATLAEALASIEKTVSSPSPVLFSPAGASFDEFKNFEDRGRFFTEQMLKLLDKP
jgi:UDP-N-acetylmuramoylalanine--D-glutamate ligase